MGFEKIIGNLLYNTKCIQLHLTAELLHENVRSLRYQLFNLVYSKWLVLSYVTPIKRAKE